MRAAVSTQYPCSLCVANKFSSRIERARTPRWASRNLPEHISSPVQEREGEREREREGRALHTRELTCTRSRETSKKEKRKRNTARELERGIWSLIRSMRYPNRDRDDNPPPPTLISRGGGERASNVRSIRNESALFNANSYARGCGCSVAQNKKRSLRLSGDRHVLH